PRQDGGQRRRADLGSKAGGVACHNAGRRNGGGARADRQGERRRSDRGSRSRWRESRRESRGKGGRESWREGWRESRCGACCRSERGEEGRQGSKGHEGGEKEVALRSGRACLGTPGLRGEGPAEAGPGLGGWNSGCG